MLAADSGGPTETVVDGETGLLRQPKVEAWSPALAELIGMTPDRRKAVGDAARKRVRDHFSADTLGRELESACREASGLGDLHTLIGDKLIWGGGVLMIGSAAALGLTIWLSG